MKANSVGILVISALAAVTGFAVAPMVDQDSVKVSQDASSRLVTVKYKLTGAPAVITVDFQTNTTGTAEGTWASIGEVNFTNVNGTVNQVVSNGDEERSIWWRPDLSWPNHIINGGKIRAVVKAWSVNTPPDYCAVCLLSDDEIEARKRANVAWNIPRVRYFVSAEAVPGGVQDRIYKTEFLLLRKIPAAGVVWRMGSPSGEYDRNESRERPHKVMLSKDYYIGVYEITQSQFTRLYGSNPSIHQGDDYPDSDIYPVGKIGWGHMRGSPDLYNWPTSDGEHRVDNSKFIGILRGLSGIESFDIPTEAQWEYACRAGYGTAYGNGGLNDKDSSWGKIPCEAMAWYYDNSEVNGVRRPHPVGEKDKNCWGLYDMHGNALEWCLDWLADVDEAATDKISENPIGPASGTEKVLRGGGYASTRIVCRSACRSSIGIWGSDNPTGFRVVCDAVAK